MKALLVIFGAAIALAGCSALNWDRDDDGPTAREMGQADCGLGGAHSPAGPGDWVCEENGDTTRQTQNPVYPGDN